MQTDKEYIKITVYFFAGLLTGLHRITNNRTFYHESAISVMLFTQ